MTCQNRLCPTHDANGPPYRHNHQFHYTYYAMYVYIHVRYFFLSCSILFNHHLKVDDSPNNLLVSARLTEVFGPQQMRSSTQAQCVNKCVNSPLKGRGLG